MVLPALAATLAAQIDGSFGGGHEKAVLWNEFEGIKKLTDGKYHFVRQSRVGAEGEQAARGGAGLWDFAMQVFFVCEACVTLVFCSHVCNFLSGAMPKGISTGCKIVLVWGGVSNADAPVWYLLGARDNRGMVFMRPLTSTCRRLLCLPRKSSILPV